MGSRLLRYLSAILLFAYGFAKINGSQFTILDSELDKPMGQVGGLWLTWYYFGFSHFYGTILALVEIGGGILLMFRRTTLLGACLLVPMLTNVVLIDIFYGVDPGATAVAILLLAAMAGLIAPRKQELMALLWPQRISVAHSPVHIAAKWGLLIAMLAVTCGFTYWVANYNNRAPTPIDGSWDVAEVEPQNLAAQVPKALFFEYNRANMAVFKTIDGSYQTHHFEIDASTHRIQMWQNRLTRGSRIFVGTWRLADSELSGRRLAGCGRNRRAATPAESPIARSQLVFVLFERDLDQLAPRPHAQLFANMPHGRLHRAL